MSPATLVSHPTSLADALRPARRGGLVVGLVPTMGALHEGHLRLLEAARQQSEFVVVSVFVNPIQFDRQDDFARYPRDLASDVGLAGDAGADVVFGPSVEAMYPSGRPVVTVDPGVLGEVLEGASRPGHFRGVATVVSKLFALVAPELAFFGEKDYQQLLVITQLVTDLSFPLGVVPVATVREQDGLALSSRNRRLAPEERAAAPVLHRALLVARQALGHGATATEAEGEMSAIVAKEPLVRLDYARVLDAATLGPPGDGELRLLIAAEVGPVRLIDNIGVDRRR